MIRKMLQVFIYSIAGTTIGATIFITIFKPEALLSYYLLWQIISISALCACGNLIYHSKCEISKRQMMFRMIFHFLYINLVVVGGAYLFGWFQPEQVTEGAAIFILNAVVYTNIMRATFRQEEKTAKDLNLRLRKYQSTKNETEEDR